MKIFDTNDENAIPKKVVCLTDRDPVRKVESGNYEKCYPFELGTDNETYDYSNNSSQLINIKVIKTLDTLAKERRVKPLNMRLF